MTGRELLKLLECGSTITCKTNGEIFEEIIFGDSNMIVEVSLDRKVESMEDCFVVILDGRKFVKENHANAKANWYDSNHEPTLKYFELPSYKGTELDDLYVSVSADCDCGLDIVEMDSLLKEYSESGFNGSYTNWLELELNKARI